MRKTVLLWELSFLLTGNRLGLIQKRILYILISEEKRNEMMTVNIAIVIPVFRPDGRLKMCIERLLRQSVMPDQYIT